MEDIKNLDNGQEQLQEDDGKKRKRKPRDKSPEAKKRRRNIALAIILLIVSAILVVIIITAIGNAIIGKTLPKYAKSFETVKYAQGSQVIPVKDADGYWTFKTDKPLKVVQLTDIHIGGGLFSASTDKKVLNAIAAMITAEKPDLVIATGDVAYPVPFSAGTGNNKQAARAFADLMENLGVYWTMTFGNHDTEVYSKYNRRQMSDFYSSGNYKYCLFDAGPKEIEGYGNAIIKIKNTKGLVTRALVMLDSHAYLPSDPLGVKWHYDNIREDQTKWYAQEIAKINDANTAVINSLPVEEQSLAENIKYKKVNSSLYFHIPLKEYKDAWTKYIDNSEKNIENKIELKYGRIGESGKFIYHGIGSDNVFDTMVKVGGDSTFCGHDHYNNISLDYWKEPEQERPIRLTYGVSLDYLAYIGIAGKGSQRGCTVIIYDGAGFDITPENYYQDKYKNVAKYKVEKVKIVEEHVPRK